MERPPSARSRAYRASVGFSATLPQLFFPAVATQPRGSGQRVFGLEALSPRHRSAGSVTFPLRPSDKITKVRNEATDCIPYLFCFVAKLCGARHKRFNLT